MGASTTGPTVVSDQQSALLTGNITAAQTIGGAVAGATLAAAVMGGDGFAFTLDSTGQTGGSITIVCDASYDNGATWFPMGFARADIPTIYSNAGVTITTPGRGAYLCDAPGATNVRVRASAFAPTGIAAIAVQITTTTAVVEAGGTMNTQLIRADTGAVLAVGNSSIDAQGVSSNVIEALALQSAYNGATWDRVRTPAKVYGAVATAAGDTAVATPAAGKKVRVMRYSIQITANAAQAVGGLLEVVLRDATTALALGRSVFVPGAAGATFGSGDGTGWVDVGNGFLSALANNVINVNLSAALTAGEVRVVIAGTEE